MKIDVVFLASDVSFTPKEKETIATILTTHGKKAARVLRYNPRTFTFTVHPGWLKDDREGMPAFTQAKDWVWIGVNLKRFRTKTIRPKQLERLAYLAYHEMHHAARGYSGFLPRGKTHILMNSIISEGLADTFAFEQYPSSYTRNKMHIAGKEAKKWLARIEKEKMQWSSDYAPSWIYGGKGKPKDIAYVMGRYIISELKKKIQRINATALVRADAKKVLQLFRANV